jgi:hypothetical protein
MNDAAPAKMATRFDWSRFSPTTSRALLRVAYGRYSDLARRLGASNAAQLAAQLRAVYGSPPKASKLEHWDAWEVLRSSWALKEAKKVELATLVSYLMAGLPVDERLDERSTMVSLRNFTRSRYMTGAFKTNLRAAFIRAHKQPMPTSRVGQARRSDQLTVPSTIHGFLGLEGLWD